MVKNLPAVQETWVQSLGQEDPLEKGMANHPSVLAWEIPWTEEPSGLQSMGSQTVGHDWPTNTFTFQVLSTLITFRWDCMVSEVRTFTPDRVLCALGHGDLGRGLAWPLSWKTPCLCLNVSAQMSGAWSWDGFLWVTVFSAEWGSMVLPGMRTAVGFIVSPPRQVHPPWGSWRLLRRATWELSQFPSTFVWGARLVCLVSRFQGTGSGTQSWAAGEFAAVTSFRSTVSSENNRAAPFFQPSSPLFSQHLGGTRKRPPQPR